MLLTLPAAVALAVVPGAIVAGLFERGAFTAADTPATAYALGIFALGLPGFVMIKVFSPAYFAREDTKTPMIYATISLVANTLGSIALFFLFRAYGLMPHLGIAVATTLGGWLNAGLLYATLARRGLLRCRSAAAAHAAAHRALERGDGRRAVARGGCAGGELRHAPTPPLLRVAALAGLVASGFAVYVLAVFATGALDLRQLRGFLKRRAPPGPI